MNRINYNKTLPIFLSIVSVGILACFFYLQRFPVFVNPKESSNRNEFRIAHRCGKAIYPENTLFACEQIFREDKADILEMDVHLTKDDHLVVIHDSTVDRTTNGIGKVESLNYDEIKNLDAGFHFTVDTKSFPYRGKGIQILELEDFFKRLPNAKYYIEIKIKNPIAAKMVIELVKKYSMQRKVYLGSAIDSVNQDLRNQSEGKIQIFSGIRETLKWYFAFHLGLRGLVSTPKVLAIPSFIPITKNFIKAVTEQNIKVHIFTVNEKDKIREYEKLGVDGVMTDDPNLFKD